MRVGDVAGDMRVDPGGRSGAPRADTGDHHSRPWSDPRSDPRSNTRSDTRHGLHSSTFRLNVSAFRGIGVAYRGCSGNIEEVFGGIRGVSRVYFVSETAQVELNSGRV